MDDMSLFGKLFRRPAAAPADAAKLDGTTEAALARSLSALPPGERGWITFAETRSLFSTKGADYAFGETAELTLFSVAASAQTYGAPYGKGKAPPPPPVVTKG